MVLSLLVRFLFAANLVAVVTLVVPQSACLAETVLLDFSSPSCGPCRQMRPVVQRLADDGFRVQEVDISRDPQTAARFGVNLVPTFIVLVDGQPVDRVVGATSYEQLRSKLLQATPPARPRQRARPLGQSPSTFAPTTTPAALAPISGSNGPRVAAENLHEPLPNRVVSLQNPHTMPTRPSATRPSALTNPFGASVASAPSVPSLAASSRPIESSQGSPSSAAHQRLLAATVKITVEDPQGKSSGTGTIVDARSGEALILTCGHIFRSSKGKGPITVTTFGAGPTGATPGAAYAGHLIDFDLERDLALVSMRPTAPVLAVPIAATSAAPIAPGATVTSVGCNHGQNPTAVDSRVAALNRYQGPSNVEVAGAPVEGRSGGGLFNAQGELVGVCYAADPQGNEGLYAALPSIYAKLDSLSLTMVYQRADTKTTDLPIAQSNTARQPRLAIRGQEPEPSGFAKRTLSMAPAEQAALAEIQRRGANSEVICIIRPQDPTGKSEVITLSNASPAFVQALANPSSASNSQPSAAEAAGQLLR